MKTADGIAIVELQDRSWGCLLMMFFNIWFLIFIAPLFYKGSMRPKIPTYLAVLFTLWWDGLGSCLRTREFDEYAQLLKRAVRLESVPVISTETEDSKPVKRIEIQGWEFTELPKVLHTFPFGYVKIIIGRRGAELVRQELGLGD